MSSHTTTTTTTTTESPCHCGYGYEEWAPDGICADNVDPFETYSECINDPFMVIECCATTTTTTAAPTSTTTSTTTTPVPSDFTCNGAPCDISNAASLPGGQNTSSDWNSSGNWKDTGTQQQGAWDTPTIYSFTVDSSEHGYNFEFETCDNGTWGTTGTGGGYHLFDSWLCLKDSTGNTVNIENDDGCGDSDGYGSYINATLNQGTYYLTVVGYSSSGGGGGGGFPDDDSSSPDGDWPHNFAVAFRYTLTTTTTTTTTTEAPCPCVDYNEVYKAMMCVNGTTNVVSGSVIYVCKGAAAATIDYPLPPNTPYNHPIFGNIPPSCCANWAGFGTVSTIAGNSAGETPCPSGCVEIIDINMPTGGWPDGSGGIIKAEYVLDVFHGYTSDCSCTPPATTTTTCSPFAGTTFMYWDDTSEECACPCCPCPEHDEPCETTTTSTTTTTTVAPTTTSTTTTTCTPDYPTWNSTTTYSQDDIVCFPEGGYEFTANQSSINKPPPTCSLMGCGNADWTNTGSDGCCLEVDEVDDPTGACCDETESCFDSETGTIPETCPCEETTMENCAWNWLGGDTTCQTDCNPSQATTTTTSGP